MTTTTGGAARVLAMMEDYRQTEWTDLEVWLTSVTEQWAVIAVQGPLARQVIERVAAGIDLAPVALPHMAVAEGSVCRRPGASLPRELHGRARLRDQRAGPPWPRRVGRRLRGRPPLGITPYGTETMHVLRAEKGYIIVGQDTDGTATPDDAGLSWAIGRKKPDFVGKRSIERATMKSPERKQLVGLRTQDPRDVLEEGAQLVDAPGLKPPMKPHRPRELVIPERRARLSDCARDGRGRPRAHRADALCADAGGDIAVTVTSPVFHDPEGVRLHG